MAWFKSRDERFIEKHIDGYLSSVEPAEISRGVANAIAASTVARARKKFGRVCMADPSGYALAHIAKRLNRPELLRPDDGQP